MCKSGFVETLYSLCLFLQIGFLSVTPLNAHEQTNGWECKVALVKQSTQCHSKKVRATKLAAKNLKAAVNQAESLYLLGKHDEAFKALRPLALQGSASAQFYLAELYQTDTKKSDKDKTIFWYRKAADQGNPNAQFNLANAYYNGRIVRTDLLKAAKWYQRAAISGVPEAQLNLGFMYSRGKGVPKNYEVATLWYEAAAKRGNIKAQSNLGYRYCIGAGVQISFAQCAYWVKQAMDKGNENAKKIWVAYKLERHFKRGKHPMS